MASKSDETAQAIYSRRLSVEEFLVDFLGGLVPGLCFITAATAALSIPLHALALALLAPPVVSQRGSILSKLILLMDKTANTPSAIWLGLFLGSILVSYVVGHLFYRHDPKYADRESFQRLARTRDNDSQEKRRINLGCAEKEDCEFPYPHIDEYLAKRGLDHLRPFVLWRDNRDLRSKNYINILKIRLRHHYPDRCGVIIRNEAHVRLASSTWYVAKLLVGIGLLGMAIAVLAMGIAGSGGSSDGFAANLAWHLPAILAPTVVVLLSAYARWAITGFLHYQRMREVVFVLETAFTAFRETLDLLDPPFADLSAKRHHARSSSQQNAGGEVRER